MKRLYGHVISAQMRLKLGDQPTQRQRGDLQGTEHIRQGSSPRTSLQLHVVGINHVPIKSKTGDGDGDGDGRAGRIRCGGWCT